jgi:ATP-binding cassette ChvD family protein
MAHFIMQLENVRRVFDQTVILEDLTLAFYYGAKIGVLGRNGAGKSTLLRIMAGEDTEFEGTLRHHPGTRIGHVSQEPKVDLQKTVRAVVEEGVADRLSLEDEFNRIWDTIGSLDFESDEYKSGEARAGRLQEQMDKTASWKAQVEQELELAADALELPPWDAVVGRLSGGERRRVALCRTLLSKPDLLLLDEPTNHLDASSVWWLQRYLQQFAGTVIAVTHDRYFLESVAEWILEIDKGQAYGFRGNYSAWLEAKQKRREAEQRKKDAVDKAIAREIDWIRANPKARQAKPQARIKNFERLQAQAFELREQDIELQIPPAPKLGTRVLDIKGLRKGYGDVVLIDGLDLELPPGGIIGIIGPNGAGKTTLFKMIMGVEKPDAGTITLGETVVVNYIDQSRDTLVAEKTVFDEICDGQDQIPFGKDFINGRAYAKRFGFRGAEQQRRVGVLSGGERNRVQLARVLRSGANLILLDEPTNDLDVDTLRILEEALLDWNGCTMVVSHDRFFLDRVATHILAFEGEGKVRWFNGNFQAYMAKRTEEIGEDALVPRRLKYKRLGRG